MIRKPALLLVLTALLFSCSGRKPARHSVQPAYVPVSKTLYEEIAVQDSLLFAAFNSHDKDKLMSWFSEDLEFYHDKGGLSDYAGTGEGFEHLFSANKNTWLRRDRVPGSWRYTPIGEYGAVETCLHRFCHKENGKDDCGTFKNIMIWKKTASGWKVTRVISYDH